MANIVPKLNLNRTPNIVENNSLIFAKNIRLDVDNTIHKDWSITNKLSEGKSDIFERIKEDIEYFVNNNENIDVIYEKKIISILTSNSVPNKETNPKIVGYIADSNDFYLFITSNLILSDNPIPTELEYSKLYSKDFIVKYSEKNNRFSLINCHWEYKENAHITGYVTNNLRGEIILSIGQYYDNENNIKTLEKIPIIHINLNTCKAIDDIGIYSQNPPLLLTNISNAGYFSFSIPNGVYQFFIRYKIRENYYTDWFPASKELFIGNKETKTTNYGNVVYCNHHRDSDKSFILNINHLFENKFGYKKFQIGFILSHDDAIYAREWKEFDINTTKIDFNYKAQDAKEIEITDLLKPIYNLYNVKNITSFKNKLYIANYIESDFNDNSNEVITCANNIKLALGLAKINGTNKEPVVETEPPITENNYNIISKNSSRASELTTYYDVPCITSSANSLDVIRINNIRISDIISDIISGDKYQTGPDPEKNKNVLMSILQSPWKAELGDNPQDGINGTDYLKYNNYNDYLKKEVDATTIFTVQEANESYNFNIKQINDNDDRIFFAVSLKGNCLRNEYKTGKLDSIINTICQNGEYKFDKIHPVSYIIRGFSRFDSSYDENNTYDQDCTGFVLDYFKNNTESILLGTNYPVKIPIIITYNVYFKKINETNRVPEIITTPIVTSPNQESSPLEVKAEIKQELTLSIKWNDKELVWHGSGGDKPNPPSGDGDGEGGGDENPDDGNKPPINTGDYVSDVPVIINNLKGIPTEYSTLIPYQKYKFFVHFVKQSGEITNGYPINNVEINKVKYNNEIFVRPYIKCDCIFYPVFYDIKIPKGYDACFFSILKTGNITATIADVRKTIKETDDPNEYEENTYQGYCLDINCKLIPVNDEAFNCYQSFNMDNNNISIQGTYYDSSDYRDIRFFGSNGVILLKNPHENFRDYYRTYIVAPYSLDNSNSDNLIKCTPYINESNIEDYRNTTVPGEPIPYDKCFINANELNLDGFYCEINPLIRDVCNHYYNDGTKDVLYKYFYQKNIAVFEEDIISKANFVDLQKYTQRLKYKTDSDKHYEIVPENERVEHFTLKNITNKHYVYSNYNLNFVSSDEDFITRFLNYYMCFPDASSETKETNKVTRIIVLVPSLTMSQVYNLKSMYKDYTRKLYSTYNEDSQTIFNNTIRSSKLIGDEEQINIYKFDANDYYNIPTNRGTITKIFSVGNAIVVHCKDSMFKFSGNNVLQSTDGEIQQTEQNIFDTGVTEIFGSDFGFAGLQKQNQCITTEVGYFFYDSDSKNIYLYAGDNQITKISDDIYNLFNHSNVIDVNFANDYYNNRIFISILFENNTFCTLSFSLLPNIKAFISLHDFYFNWAFNTKSNCYFLSGIDYIDNFGRDINTIDKTSFGNYNKLDTFPDELYPHIKEDNGFESIIDVIINEDYETIKTLNSVSWCSNLINGIINRQNVKDIKTTKLSEPIYKYFGTNISKAINHSPCSAIQVYTDTCMTDKIIFNNNISNNFSIFDEENYKTPRYNQGKWTLNYFRNIENGNINPNLVRQQNYNSDNNSLVEGKYFIIRFYFGDEFKLESLTVNSDRKL